MTIVVNKSQSTRRHGCFYGLLIGLLIYVLFCGLLGYFFGDMFSTPATKLEGNSVYRLEMSGVLVEQAPEDNPFAALLSDMPYMSGQSVEEVGLDQLVENIRLAKEDSRIEGILLDGGSMQMGPASAKALRDALLDYKESGKWLIAYASSYGELNYYVATVADRIYLNPTGSVDWNGLAATKMYYTRLLEKIGVDMQIVKVGTFKSAVEPYFRTSMSEADRHQTEQYIRGIWQEMVSAVADSRHLSVEQLDALADEYMGLQPAERMVSAGLVDTLVYAQTIDSVLRYKCAGLKPKKLTTSDMSEVERKKETCKDEIALVYAEGEITDESGDGIVGKDMVKTLGKIAREESVKAVVLRVNSPGGSADASEQIWHAVQLLREKGLPVVVSMGDYAASGGYYISCGADFIVAEPTTLTGSIGIFGTIPSFGKLLDKVGLDIDGVATHRHSDLETNMIYKGMNPEEQALMQSMVERGYDLFTSRCAAGRGVSQDSIRAIAEGRVWLGKDALRLGLVDSLGGIDAALEKAAALAELESYSVAYYPEREDVLTQLLKELEGTADEEERLVARVRAFVSKPRVMARMDDVIIR